MREIKFRGWNPELNKWVYWNLLLSPTEWVERGLAILNLESIGEYTGLKDKNKKEIYEGDILKDTGEVKNFGYFYRFGKYTDLKTDGDWAFSNEIIGNIYENPELLEVK